jgi:hypothetical protein
MPLPLVIEGYKHLSSKLPSPSLCVHSPAQVYGQDALMSKVGVLVVKFLA